MKKFASDSNLSLWVVFFFGVYVVLLVKYATITEINHNMIFGLYSVLVALYILSRFLIAYFYHGKSPLKNFKNSELPMVTFAVPSKNEEKNIGKTIGQISKINYPKNKFEVIAVNDGSSDNTLAEMKKAKKLATKLGVAVTVIDWKKNKGKREGMAVCVEQSRGEFIVFIDSDSFVDKNIAKEFVKYFVDPKVGAVAGHGFVANKDTNILTKMQDVRYFVAFKGYKSAEAIFGAVTCCSGCCSAYRKSAVLEVISKWRGQTFLGVKCTYGDDRALTNFLLQKGYAALFAPKAIAYTVVPDNFRQFMKQQLRWKKSWIRESLKASVFMWRRNPIMSLSFYVSVFLTLMAPFVVLRAMVWLPIRTGQPPYFYLFGLGLMAVIYSLYYYINTKGNNWFYGLAFAAFYGFFLVWQLPYAILNIRDSSWGTR